MSDRRASKSLKRGYGGGAAVMKRAKQYEKERRKTSFWSQMPSKTTKESKAITNDAGAAFNTTASIVLMNGVATGDDYTNRDGRKISMTSALLRLYFESSTTTTEPLVRLMLIYDKQANGAAPTAADIFDATIATNAVSPNNLNNRDRFVTLADEAFIMKQGVNVAGSFRAHLCRYIKLPRLQTVFSGTGATVASIATGSIYLVQVSNVASVTSTGTCRIRFIDD